MEKESKLIDFIKNNWIKLVVLIFAFGIVFYNSYYNQNEEDNVVYGKMGQVIQVDDYEVVIAGLVWEDGETNHKDRVEHFREINLSVPDWSLNYYKDTYKIVVPFISVKNLNKTDKLRFDPAYFSLVTESGFQYKHKQPRSLYEGGTLIGGEIDAGYVASGWYGFEIPKGYNEGNRIYFSIEFPETEKTILIEAYLPL